MTKVKVNGYELRRLTCKEEARRQARWLSSFRGRLRFFRTRETAVTAMSKWPPPGMQSIKA